MYQRLLRTSGAELSTSAAALVAVVGAVSVLALPAGGLNRVAGVAVPFSVAAAALVANALSWRRIAWIGGVLYGLAAVALMYAILLALSVPLTSAVEGTCPRTASSCPLGYQYPISGGENFAVYASVLAGALALVLAFIAFEVRHLHRGRRRIDPRPEASTRSPAEPTGTDSNPS